jgi:hypothetical protein
MTGNGHGEGGSLHPTFLELKRVASRWREHGAGASHARLIDVMIGAPAPYPRPRLALVESLFAV